MSTGYGWEGLSQVCATMLGVRRVPEPLCAAAVAYSVVNLGRYDKCSPLPLTYRTCHLCRELKKEGLEKTTRTSKADLAAPHW